MSQSGAWCTETLFRVRSFSLFMEILFVYDRTRQHVVCWAHAFSLIHQQFHVFQLCHTIPHAAVVQHEFGRNL